MADTFDKCFDLLMAHEGGYSNNPNDPGGETMWGVTKRVAVQNGYTEPMKSLPKEVARVIARKGYWTPYGCDKFPPAVAFQIFDTVYNGGPAISWLQECCGLPVNGKLSDELYKRAAAMDVWKLLALYNAKRLEYFASLKQPTFANGRMNRIAGNLRKGDL